jgi:hypothetical protein
LLIRCRRTEVSRRSTIVAASRSLNRVGDCSAASGNDLVDDRRRVGAGLRPEVVDHDVRALFGEESRVRATDAASGAGDDRDTPVEAAHGQDSSRSSQSPWVHSGVCPHGALTPSTGLM